MEFQYQPMNLILTSMLLVFVLAKITLRRTITKAARLPPGPWQLPVLGNMHQLVGALPHRTLQNLAKKYGPFMYLKLGEVSTIVVSSPEFAREIMKTHDIVFAQRPSLLAPKMLIYDSTNIAFSPYGEYWRQVKKICTMELLNPKRVQSLRPLREEEVSDLIRSIYPGSGSSVNLSEKIINMTFNITSRAAFGKKNKVQEAFISAVKEGIELLGGFCIGDMYPSVKILQDISGYKSALEKASKELDRTLESILTEHKKKRSMKTDNEVEEEEEDLVDVLLNIQQDGGLAFALTDNNIKAVISDMVTAGSETSSKTVEWAMSELIRNQEMMKKAQDELRNVFKEKGTVDETGLHALEYLQKVIKETLRLHPPTPLLLPRESREKCEINGYEIPPKTRVIVNAWAINRDPRYWKEAERFLPERFNGNPVDFKGTDFQFIPFGAGRRMCPGMSFGLPNVELPLANLLFHFDWELPNGMKHEDLDMSEVFGLTVGRKNDLYLIPIPYDSSSSLRMHTRA